MPARLEKLKKHDIASVFLKACSAYARRGYHMFAVIIEQIDNALQEKRETEDPTASLPPEFQDYPDVFSAKEAD
jgi:hypothetical protein